MMLPPITTAEAIARLHTRIARARDINDGPELFEDLRGEP